MNKSSFFYGLGVGIIITAFIFYSVVYINSKNVVTEDSTSITEEVDDSDEEENLEEQPVENTESDSEKVE